MFNSQKSSKHNLSEQVFQDCRVLSNILLIFNKSEKDGYFETLSTTLQTIFNQEINYTMSEILLPKQPRRTPDLKAQLINNTFIFKENLKIITRLLIDNLWEDQIRAEQIQKTISQAKLSMHKGRFEEIEELQDEENCASSGMISNVSNALNMTLASKEKRLTTKTSSPPLEKIPETERGKPEDEEFAYSYGTDFESRDLRFGSLISRSVSITPKDAPKKNETRGDQNYYETEDLDYTIDFDDDSKAGEFLNSQEGARSEKLHARNDSNEMENNSVSIKLLPKKKGTMSMVNFRNISLDLKKVDVSQSRSKNSSSIDWKSNKPAKINSLDQRRESKPFLTWGKKNMLERLKKVTQGGSAKQRKIVRADEEGTSSDKSQVSVHEIRGPKMKQKTDCKVDSNKMKQTPEQSKKVETKKTATKLKSKIKRNLTRKYTESGKLSFEKNRSHSAYKLDLNMNSSLKTKVDLNKISKIEKKLLPNRSMSECSKIKPEKEKKLWVDKKSEQPMEIEVLKVSLDKFKRESSGHKTKKKTRSPKQIMRGILDLKKKSLHKEKSGSNKISRNFKINKVGTF